MPAPALSAIMVHLDGAPSAVQRVSVAARLADVLGARLIGAAAGQFVVPVYAPFGEGFVAIQPDVIDAAHEQVRSQVAAAEAAFRAAAGERDVEWRGSDAHEPDSFLATQARAADLIVVGRGAKDEQADTVLGVALSDVVMTVGRPVLVVPPGVNYLSAKRIVVAWKDTREARRAIADALPLLKAADEVFIAGIGEEIHAAALDDVAAYLTRYGVTVKAIAEPLGDGRPATALLGIASRVNADLLVAGAFGHSRMREWVFGGVTRDLLDQATIAVLFSH